MQMLICGSEEKFNTKKEQGDTSLSLIFKKFFFLLVNTTSADKSEKKRNNSDHK